MIHGGYGKDRSGAALRLHSRSSYGGAAAPSMTQAGTVVSDTPASQAHSSQSQED